MAGDRVDIEINDRIDASVVTKLREIVNEATAGHAAVRKLKAAVDSINARAFNVLAGAAQRLTGDIDRQALAQARLQTETARASLTAARAATEQQRLATETERTAAASARAAAAQASQATATQKAAQAATAGAAAASKAASASTAHANAAAKATQGSKAQAYAMQNLVFQLNDVIVGLASGQKPMTVFLQQGSQIATIFPPGTNALKAMGQMLGSLALKFAPLIGLVAAVGAGLLIFNKAVSDAARRNISFGNVITATFQELGSRIADAVGKVGGLKDAFDGTITFVMGAFGALVDFFGIAIGTIVRVAGELPKALFTLGQYVYNLLIDIGTGVVNFFIKSVNLIVDAINTASNAVGQGNVLKRMVEVDPNTLKTPINNSVKDVFQLFDEAVQQQANSGGARGLFDAIVGRAGKLQDADLAKKFGFDRSAELAKTNAELDRQIRSMHMLSDERRVQEQLDQIAQRFLDASIKSKGQIRALDDTELAAIRSKLTTIQQYQRVQKETDRIYEDAVGPAKDYQAVIEGTRRLVNEHRITQTQANQEIARAGLALARAKDPLYDYNKGISDANKLAGLFGDELTIQVNAQSAVNAALEKGVTLSQATAEANARNALQQQQAQQALSSVYDRVAAAQRTYTQESAAAFGLLLRGKITLADYAAQVRLIKQAYEDTKDPLAAWTRGMTQQMALTQTVGIDTQVLAAQQQLYNQAVAAGIPGITTFDAFLQQYGATIRSTVTDLQNAQAVQGAVNSLLSEVGYNNAYVDHYAEMYAAIDKLRQDHVIKEGQAIAAIAKLRAASFQAQTQDLTSSLSDISGLMQSKNKEMFRVGKAAAIANATIAGVQSVMNALAVQPYPLGVALAVAAGAAAAANVAKIKNTEMGAYKDGGQFIVGGRPGVDANTISMQVTKGERVTVETAAQQRMNDGGRGTGGVSPNVSVPVKVVNVIDPEEAIAALNTPAGETAIFNVLQRNPNKVKQIASNA